MDKSDIKNRIALQKSKILNCTQSIKKWRNESYKNSLPCNFFFINNYKELIVELKEDIERLKYQLTI